MFSNTDFLPIVFFKQVFISGYVFYIFFLTQRENFSSFSKGSDVLKASAICCIRLLKTTHRIHQFNTQEFIYCDLFSCFNYFLIYFKLENVSTCRYFNCYKERQGKQLVRAIDRPSLIILSIETSLRARAEQIYCLGVTFVMIRSWFSIFLVQVENKVTAWG